MGRGNPRLTTKRELNQILDIVNAKPNDVFCDLGCGEGMLCIWASERLKYAYGIENYKKNYSKSQENKRTKLRSNVRFIFKNYDDLEKIPELKKCTIFFCTNGFFPDEFQRLEEFLKPKKFVFVSQYFATYPIMSKKYDNFYIIRTPFKVAKNQKGWIQYMLGKNKTRKDLLKIMREFPDYSNKKEELDEIIRHFNWICGRCSKTNL
ncbi:MAG TPA: methyltransferase domain-containing protein [Nitrosopumilaceae archaeon]|nr:methyltransferase domain-containing protein [Nitrosopumilaceae archaeon]